MNRLCDDIIKGEYTASNKREIEILEKSEFIKLNPEKKSFYMYSFDNWVSGIEYAVSKHIGDIKHLSILKFMQIVKNIENEYKAKLKAMKK